MKWIDPPTFVVDPIDTERAIHVESGRMAGALYFDASEMMGDSPTVSDIDQMKFVCFIPPTELEW